MANVKMILVNESDKSTLTGPSGELPNLPVTNLQKSGRTNVLRTNVLTNQTITGNMEGVKAIGGFAISNHNLTVLGEVRVRMWDGFDQTGNLTYDSGVIVAGTPNQWGLFQWGLQPWGATSEAGTGIQVLVRFFDTITASSFQIDYEDPANPENYIDFGRLFIGAVFNPQVGSDYGATFSYEDSSKQTRTDGGTLRTEVSQIYRKLTMPMNYLNLQDRAVLSLASRELGLKTEVLVSLFPDASGQLFTDYTFVGKFTRIVSFQSIFHEYFGADIVVEES